MKRLALPLLLVAVVAGMLALFAFGNRQSEPEVAAKIDGLQEFSELSQEHTAEPVKYPQTPPVGGPHNPVPAACNGIVHAQQLSNENAVHSLEHGAVWITYQSELAQGDIDALAAKVKGQNYVFMSPYPGQPQPVVLTAWGKQLGVEDADDERIDQFIAAYRQGPQTPEPGASCEGTSQPMPQSQPQ